MPEEDVKRGRSAVAIFALVLAAILAILFRESFFGGAVLTQADALGMFEPWRSVMPEGFVPGNDLLLDQARGFLPWNDFVAERLRQGELPLWCPHNYGGIPLVGTNQSAIYWPLHWIYFAWPSWHAYVWIATLKILLAGTFAFLFLRRLVTDHLAAAVGALAFALSGFMVVWLNHPHTNVALALPALLWAVERCAHQQRGRDAALFGLLVGLQLLGGHLQTSLHVALFVAAWAVFRTAVTVDGVRLSARGFGQLTVAAVLGGLMAAPQILPVLEYLGHSQAAAVFLRADLVAGEGVGGAVVMMVDPFHYGAPHTHDYTGPIGTNLNFNELVGGYVGRAILLLVLVQFFLGWRRGRIGSCAFFTVAVALAGLVAWQVEPFYDVMHATPGLDRTKLMRLLLFVAFGLSALGALGLDSLLTRLRRHRLAIGGAAFAIVAVELVVFAHGYNPQVDPQLLLPRTEVVEFLREQEPTWRVLALDNTVLAPNANTFHRVPMISGYDSVEDHAFTELVLRMTSVRPEFPLVSQIGAFDRIGALPLASLLGARWILTSSGPMPPPLQLRLDAELQVWENPGAMPKAFVATDVRVIADAEERLALLSSPAFDPTVAVLGEETEGYRRWRDAGGAPAGGDVEIERYEPREIGLRASVASGPALVVINDVHAPGWHATVDGQTAPIERVDHALRGVWLEPGEHQVVLRYDPASTTIGLWLCALALAGLGFVAFRGRRTSSPEATLADPPEGT